MTTTDVRLFIEVTTRQAEDAFRRQLEESDRRIEAQMTASRFQSRGSHSEACTQPRQLWWSERERYSAASRGHSDKERSGE
jgi:hypothetical protein